MSINWAEEKTKVSVKRTAPDYFLLQGEGPERPGLCSQEPAASLLRREPQSCMRVVGRRGAALSLEKSLLAPHLGHPGLCAWWASSSSGPAFPSQGSAAPSLRETWAVPGRRTSGNAPPSATSTAWGMYTGLSPELVSQPKVPALQSLLCLGSATAPLLQWFPNSFPGEFP